VLPGSWISLSVDDLVDAQPSDDPGIVFGVAGDVIPGTAFRDAQPAWLAGIATMAHQGLNVVYDDVCLGGAAGGTAPDRDRRNPTARPPAPGHAAHH
jgi:chloramphenicol 3-O phosphotransferase